MRISGVSSRTRSVHRRRSQLAANSSAPPTHTPSTAAIGRHRGGQHHPRHSLEALDRRRPCGRVGLERGLEVVARGEVVAGAAQNDAAHRVVARRRLDRVGDRGHGLEVPGVPARLAVPADDAGGPAVGGGDGHIAISLLSASTASGSASPRAVRWTMRVLCSATGSDPGSSRVTVEARAQRCPPAAASSRRGPPQPAPRRTRAAAGRSGRPRRPRSGAPGGSSRRGPRRSPADRRSRPARAACHRAGRRCGCAASVRPHGHGDVHTRPRSAER